LHHIPHWISYLRILGMLRHSACVTRQTHTSRYVLSISSNAAKRRFKDKKIYVVFYYNYINKKMQHISTKKQPPSLATAF
jgi:hypothetical protein